MEACSAQRLKECREYPHEPVSECLPYHDDRTGSGNERERAFVEELIGYPIEKDPQSEPTKIEETIDGISPSED